MGAKTRRARKIRAASEFDVGALQRQMRPPPEIGRVYAWTLEEIRGARDAQMRGQFARAAQLAAAMRTEASLSVARGNRLDALQSIQVEVVAAKGARGVPIADEGGALFGQEGVAITPSTCASVEGCLVDHGVAFGYNTWTPREDGSRVDVAVSYFPIEHVRWDAYKRCYVARVDSTVMVDGASEIDIVHGDGRWIIWAAFEHEPFKQHAAVLPAGLIWALIAFARRDWAKGSVAHGSAKVIGTMPEGVPLQKTNDAGATVATDEAAAFAALLRDIATSDTACGIKPFGATTEFLTNDSTAWQIFSELVNNGERAAARIYLGTDGTLGAGGSAPGVDISVLFGVASTKIQGDTGTISRGLATGTIEVWTAINFGDSTLAPSRRYILPDADADAARASEAARTTAFFDEIDRAAKRFEITQDYADKVAKKHGVDAPTLIAKPTAESLPSAAPAALRSITRSP